MFYPDQRMSRAEALKSYTWNAAYAAFEEDSRGSLKVGKYADLIVLSKDITKIPEDEIPTTEVMLHDRRREGAISAGGPAGHARPVIVLPRTA